MHKAVSQDCDVPFYRQVHTCAMHGEVFMLTHRRPLNVDVGKLCLLCASTASVSDVLRGPSIWSRQHHTASTLQALCDLTSCESLPPVPADTAKSPTPWAVSAEPSHLRMRRLAASIAEAVRQQLSGVLVLALF